MPVGLVIPKRLPVSPGNDSKFKIRHRGNEWWIYYEAPDGSLHPADDDHAEVVQLVNALKEAEGTAPGGAFSINEHFQIIARMQAPEDYKQNTIHVVDISGGDIARYSELITFDDGVLDPSSTPVEGDEWPGPRCGMTYRFAAPNNKKPPSHNLDEVWTEVEGQIVQLSSHLAIGTYPPAGGVTEFIAALRRQLPNGGRFRVNERGRAFTANENIFIGIVPLPNWFRPISIAAQ
jgi:hypothetical protein